jgi:hypothetical protein
VAKIIDRGVMAAVAAAAIVIAGAMLAGYLADPDLLWRGVYHDRNAHFAFGLDLALALRNLDPLWFLAELDKAKVWPPLHGLALAAVLLVAGPDHRFAIVPSLVGFVTTVVFGALIARTASKDRIAGILAAAVTAILTLASPALRLLASDVMLEGLGAGLSAAALWAYGRARADPRPATWRLLALLLTALFFEKSNYWGLVGAALVATICLQDRARWSAAPRAALAFTRAHVSWHVLIRDPLLIAAAVTTAVVIALYARGPTAVELFGRTLSLYPPENLTTLAYALVFARVALALYRRRDDIAPHLGVAGRELLLWHAAPVAVWFLLPRRLSAFLWFVGPANHDWQRGYDLLGGVALYWRAFVEGFHPAPLVAALTIVLMLAAWLKFHRLPPAVRAALLLALISAVAVVLHPQHQPRFLASWIFAIWIGAGAGAGLLFERLRARFTRPACALIATVAVGLLAAAALWTPPSPRAAVDALRADRGSSDLDLVRPYLAELDGARAVMFAATFGSTKLFQWMLHERCRCKTHVEDPSIANAGSRAEVRARMTDRVARTPADVVVVIDAPGGRYTLPKLGWVYDTMAGIPDAMSAQSRFKRLATYDLPGQGAQATLWRRVSE